MQKRPDSIAACPRAQERTVWTYRIGRPRPAPLFAGALCWLPGVPRCYNDPVPLPTLISLAFAIGMAAALAARVELRVSPRHPLLTRSFGAYVLFASLVLVPISVYFYVFHGDWFLLYTFDVRQIPSAVALVGFVAEIGIGALGFLFGTLMVRNQRETLGGVMLGLAFLSAGIVMLVAEDRLRVVGSFAQFTGGFGLEPFADGPLMHGSIAMGGILTVAVAALLLRIATSGQRV